VNKQEMGLLMADKPFWKSEAPADHEKRALSDKQKRQAKARAAAAGRPYPNLVDNAAVSRKKKGK
jgi:hypothetical protein